MPSGLIALLDDVATLTKLAAASVDDVGLAAGKAGTKAAGVVIDDTAVTPRYVTGLLPERELPIIAKITVGSLKNKLLIILPVALLLSAFAPFLIPPILMIGGAYLAYEATEKILEKLSGDDHDECELLAADTPAELEARQVAGAIRTDFILSAEIMVIALAELSEEFAGDAVGRVGRRRRRHHHRRLWSRRFDREARRHRPPHDRAPKRRGPLGRQRPGPRRPLSAFQPVGARHRGDAVGRRRDHPPRHGTDGVRGDPALRSRERRCRGAGGRSDARVVEWLANAIGASIGGLIVGGAIVGLMHLRPKRRKPEADECPPEIV